MQKLFHIYFYAKKAACKRKLLLKRAVELEPDVDFDGENARQRAAARIRLTCADIE